jgi:hypothetical protein
MPGYLYDENEVIERKANAHVSRNGVVTAGAKYVNNPDVRIDVIVVRKAHRVQKITTKNTDEMTSRIDIDSMPQHDIFDMPSLPIENELVRQ